MLNKVDQKLEYPQCLCVCPVRELARQIADVVTQMAQFTKIKIQLVVPDAESKHHFFISSPFCDRVVDFFSVFLGLLLRHIYSM